MGHAICVLPNNVVHQKFYLFLWFWLLGLTLVTFIHQIYRVCLLLLPSFRVTVTKMMWRETWIPWWTGSWLGQDTQTGSCSLSSIQTSLLSTSRTFYRTSPSIIERKLNRGLYWRD